MKLTMIENPTTYHIQLVHPDYGSEFHDIAVADDSSHYVFTDEEWAEYHEELFKMLKEKYNKYGYWHEMIVTAEYVIDGKVYQKEIQEG